MEASHIIVYHDVGRSASTIGEQGPVLLGWGKVGTGSGSIHCVSELVVPGYSFPMASTAHSMVAIPVAISLSTGHTISVMLIHWEAQPIQHC